MTQHGLLHSGVTMATQSYAQHPQDSGIHSRVQKFSPLEHSLHCEKSTSPTSSPRAPHDPAEASDLEVTPPTSSSGLSSQETPNFPGQNCSLPASEGAVVDTLPAATSKSTAQSPSSAGNVFGSLAAPKRTSSGQIKISNNTGGDGAGNNHGSSSRHSPTPSLPSNGSSVTELSRELRTRLSYAMVKVKNGWEANSLEEIESLTSQHASPRTPSATPTAACSAQTVRSPKTAMAPILRRQGSSSVSCESTVLAGGTSQWDHGAQGAASQRRGMEARPHQRGLAPPADIVPGARQRPYHANQHPDGYRSGKTLIPTRTKQRTASQNAAMEADAVETLLFMASPGNPSHHPSTSLGIMSSTRTSPPTSSPTSSPFGSEFPTPDLLASPQRRVAFVDPTRTAQRTVGISCRSDEIDRMIDEMDDVSDNGGAEYISNTAYSTSARR